MLVGIITLVLALTVSYTLFVCIVLALSLNKRFVKWYTKRAIALMGDIAVDMPEALGDLMEKLNSAEEKAE